MYTSLHSVLFLFLLLNSKALVLAATTACPDNNCCTAIQNQLTDMMTFILAINSTLKEQARDLEEMKTNIDQVVVATNLTSTQLGQHMHDQLVHDDRLKLHAEVSSATHQMLESIDGAELGPRDCYGIRKMGFTASGVYRVYPGNDDRRIQADVYCDLNSTMGDDWLVFQRRTDGSVHFERHFSDYERGFGNLSGEFWLGNEKLSLLTMNRRYKLLIELEDFEGEKRYAEYSNFTVAPATDKYRLTVGGYSGNAGDSMTYHSGMQFTTSEVDNDWWIGNCAMTFHGAWWYRACHLSNLNGLYLHGNHSSYADGIEWSTWLGYYYSLKTTEMKIAAY